MRYALFVRYNGAFFSGSAKNASAPLPGVTNVLQEAIGKFVGEENWCNLQGSSRTDAGVHAIRNSFHVDLTHRKRQTGEVAEHHSPLDVEKAVNFYLPTEQVQIDEVWQVPDTFHARHDAIARTYMYRILHGTRGRWLFEDNRSWVIPRPLDTTQMQTAAHILMGEHDFSSFRAAGCAAKTPVRTVQKLDIQTVPGEASLVLPPHMQLTTITIQANSFVYKMVRNIVGALVNVGLGELRAAELEALLAKRDRTLAPSLAPPHGLYLSNVHYPSSFQPCLSSHPSPSHQTQL